MVLEGLTVWSSKCLDSEGIETIYKWQNIFLIESQSESSSQTSIESSDDDLVLFQFDF